VKYLFKKLFLHKKCSRVASHEMTQVLDFLGELLKILNFLNIFGEVGGVGSKKSS